MKSKYVMINGLAFSEENDMERLKNYASQGWILEDIIGGLFYKLKKDKVQDIVYSLDYQTDANEEYLTIFKEAGWELVVSVGKQMHIFSAKAGTKPIYSDCESEIDKYTKMRNRTGKGTIYSLVVAIALMCLLVVSVNFLRPAFLIIIGVLIIDMCVFVFNFMPYLAYNFRIKQMRKNGKRKSEIINSKILWKVYAFTGFIFMVMGILDLIEKKYLGIVFIILGIFNIVISLNYYKKYIKIS